MRGERAIPGVDATWIAGSSPHARGTPVGGRHVDTDQRFIPACAGNAPSATSKASAKSVHPRMRGERQCLAATRLKSVGSSPHARGTLLIIYEDNRQGRFIPACAGNASTITVSCTPVTVHPRMRGERGFVVNADPRYSRFIPACAGNAGGPSRPAQPWTVHPRMRGERPVPASRGSVCRGSSPHARGTPASSPSSSRTYRFIPACAGNAGE